MTRNIHTLAHTHIYTHSYTHSYTHIYTHTLPHSFSLTHTHTGVVYNATHVVESPIGGLVELVLLLGVQEFGHAVPRGAALLSAVC